MGKTILSFLVREMSTRAKEFRDISLAYYFCDAKMKDGTKLAWCYEVC
jgi:hypothetical protein